MFISMHSILGWASFCMNYCINAAWHEGDQPVALLRCNEAQVLQLICIVGSGVSHHILSIGFRSGEFADQSITVTHGHWTSFWYLWQCVQVPSPAGKWNHHLHKACQQKEAWSALKYPEDVFRKHSGSTPADDMAAQIITDCGNYTLDFKQHGFCVSPLFLQTLGPWFTNEMLNVLSSEKRTLDHWATVQFFFSLAQERCFWRLFLFQKWLGSSFPEDVWALDALTPASVHSLWSSLKCLNRLCIVHVHVILYMIQWMNPPMINECCFLSTLLYFPPLTRADTSTVLFYWSFVRWRSRT